MLTSWKKNQAAEIAQVLATEGMIFGQELEEYIRLEEVNGIISLKEHEIDEFIDEVIKMVEFQWRKAIAIYDIKQNTTKVYLTAKEAAYEINTTLQNIYCSKRINSRVNNRYLVSIYKPNVDELSIGLNTISSKTRNGYYLKI